MPRRVLSGRDDRRSVVGEKNIFRRNGLQARGGGYRYAQKEDADVAVDIGETRVYERRSEFIDTYEKVTGVHGRQVTDMVKEITENKLPVAKSPFSQTRRR